jgi:hypothetical protein
MRRTLKLFMLVAVIPAALALVPATASAQRSRPSGGGQSTGAAHPSGPPPSAAHAPQGGGHPGGAPPPRGGYYGGYRGYYGGYRGYYGGAYMGYYGYPYFGFGFGWGWGYPYWYGGYGYPYWGYDPTPEIRLEVKPREAQVYVDGYYAGIVDDFDGTFQRLRVRPGAFELTLYLKGYHTVTQNIHVGQGQDSKIKFQMEPLAAGETNDPPPQPKAAPPEDRENAEGYQGYPGGQPQAPRRPAEPRQPVPPSVQVGGEQGQGFGSLVIRVQPSGAEVLVDGERWQGPEGTERLVIQVAEGSHRIEVRKEGFAPFSATLQVRRGETAPLNVSLPPKGE